MTSNAATMRRLVRRVSWPLRIALLGAIVALIAWRVPFGDFKTALRPSSWAFVAAAVAANFVSVVLKGASWKAVVDGLPAMRRPSRLRDLVSPLLIGFLFNTVLAARVGEIAKVMLTRRRLLKRGQDVSVTSLLGSVVAENLFSTVAFVVLVVLIGLFLPLSRAVWITVIVVGVVCLAVVVVALFRSPGRHVPPWLNTGPLWARASRGILRLWAAVRESHLGLRDPRQMALVMLPGFGAWLAQWLGIYCALRGFGIGGVGWGAAGLLLVTVTVAQAFPVLPGNIGVFQAAVIVPLTASYGVSKPAALAFSIGLQATEVVVGVVIGFVFLMVEGVSFRQLREEAERESQDRGATHTADAPQLREPARR